MKKTFSLFPIIGIMLITMMLVTAACTKKGEGVKPTVRIAENPWTSASTNAHIARILLQEQLGYPVKLVPIDGKGQWELLAGGNIHASLEIWPSGREEQIRRYMDEQKVVENIGLLGVVGKVSWYVPTYVVEEHPELATWEGFKDPRLAGLFKTSQTGSKGRFLAGDGSWVQYDRDIIHNLGLHLQVVWAGSESALLAELYKAYTRKQPILFYLWTPHAALAKYRLTPVKLPRYSDACYARAGRGGVACDYPPEVLFKVIWPGLKTMAPEAYQFLRNFNYTNDDQITMLAMVETEGKTTEEAARIWINKNKSKWKTWIPAE